jgi:hypothetical protein
LAKLLEERGRACTLLAEVEIMADDHPGHAELSSEQAVDEVGRGRGREPGIEAPHEGAVEPELSEDDQLRGLRGQPEQGFVRREEFARMRLEGEDRGRRVPLADFRYGDVDERPVAAMDAVEIADRHHRTTQRRRHGFAVAAHREGARRHVRLIG